MKCADCAELERRVRRLELAHAGAHEPPAAVSPLDPRVEPEDAIARARSDSQRALAAARQATEYAERAGSAAQVAEVALVRQRRASQTLPAPRGRVGDPTTRGGE